MVSIPGTIQDRQSITSGWQLIAPAIHGVAVHDVRHVPKERGHLTEVWRKEWKLDPHPVDQVFSVTLLPGALSAWHVHRETTDRFFVVAGTMKVVLYDPRKESPTRGMINEFRIGVMRPVLLVVPPGIYHGVANNGDTPAVMLNLVDEAYRYEDPDHWRLPADTDKVPYRWKELPRDF